MSKYKETRTLYGDTLRQLCINKNWYTNGSNEDYENLFAMCHKNNITTNDIITIATDIYNHSNTDYEVSGIAFEIARICYSHFEKA